MSTVQLFKLQPLYLVLKLLAVTPMLLISDMGYARVLTPDEVLNIDGTTATDNYVLNGKSTLNTNGGVTRDITVNNSTLNLNGTTVQATSANGVHLNAGTANITGGKISSDRIGLVVSRDSAGTQGSTATVSGNTNITGVTAGATTHWGNWRKKPSATGVAPIPPMTWC